MSWIDEYEMSETYEQGEITEVEVSPEAFESYEATEQVNEAEESNEGIIGNPEEAVEHWHVQETSMSCAVAAQEFVAEELMGDDYSEEKMRAYAEEHGWFSEAGTPVNDVGNLLEAMGLDVTRECNGDINEIAETLENGGKVIVGVNNMVLEDVDYADTPGISANHAVEVIGIDVSDPDNIEVILNDSGVEDGAGRRVSLETFQAAWNTSDNFMTTAYRK